MCIATKALTDGKVSDRAYRLYAVLTSLADEHRAVTRYRTAIAKVMGKSKRSVDRALEELAETGYVAYSRTDRRSEPCRVQLL